MDWAPVPVFLLEHPQHGALLVDTGYAADSAVNPKRTLGSTAWLFPHRSYDVNVLLERAGVKPSDISTVVMTHLHSDHASGAERFPDATFIADHREWEIGDRGGLGIRKGGYIPGIIKTIKRREMLDFTGPRAKPLGPFNATIDLFGDGSVVLCSTPGHAPGHQSVLVRLGSGGEVLLTGDAADLRSMVDKPVADRRHVEPLGLHGLARGAPALYAAASRDGRDPRARPRDLADVRAAVRVVGMSAERRSRLLALASLTGIVAGGILALTGNAHAADVAWSATIVVMLVPLTWEVARALLRGDIGVDVIALLAMASALAAGEQLAGAIVALMLSGGNALEDYAAGRARRDLTALLERAPHVAQRRVGDTWEEVAVDTLVPGDVVLVRTGEVVAVDGTVQTHEAVVDESAMTGESLPVTIAAGGNVRSGISNAGEPFEVLATRRADESSYAALVRLVEAAESERAPFVRMADRYAVWFLGVTLVLAIGAWAASGDPVRAVAVLVIATPCPLILAAPIALVAGLSRAARAGVIIKGGTAIEGLGGARTVLLDKTGTLTVGHPQLHEVITLNGVGEDELLRLAASLDQLSPHVLASALVREATTRGLHLDPPDHVVEAPGGGIEGQVGGRTICVGSAAFVGERGYAADDPAGRLEAHDDSAGMARVTVGVDGHVAGAIVMADHLRDDAPAMVTELRRLGIVQVAIVTGDRESVAQRDRRARRRGPRLRRLHARAEARDRPHDPRRRRGWRRS